MSCSSSSSCSSTISCCSGVYKGCETCFGGCCTPISTDCCSCGVIGTSCLPRCNDISCYTCYSRTYSPGYRSRLGCCYNCNNDCPSGHR